jgi:hypothetical protein
MTGDRETGALRWARRAALLSWLLAVPGLAAGPTPCQAQCAGSLSKETQACMKKCPSPSKKGKRDDYQACAQVCSEHFQREYDKCDQKCEKPKKEHPKKTRRHH